MEFSEQFGELVHRVACFVLAVRKHVAVVYELVVFGAEVFYYLSNCLRRAGINTVEELCNKTPDDMIKVRNLGKKSLDEVLLKLKQLNLHLRS